MDFSAIRWRDIFLLEKANGGDGPSQLCILVTDDKE